MSLPKILRKEKRIREIVRRGNPSGLMSLTLEETGFPRGCNLFPYRLATTQRGGSEEAVLQILSTHRQVSAGGESKEGNGYGGSSGKLWKRGEARKGKRWLLLATSPIKVKRGRERDSVSLKTIP